MRFITCLILLFLAKAAFANPFNEISRKKAVCMSASFTPQYLAAHPQQKTSEIWMKLYMEKDPKDPTLYMNLQLKVSGTVYRAGMLCSTNASGSLRCAVECDGGQAEVMPNDKAPTNALFVNKGFYVTTVCDPTETPILLDPSTGGDDVFDLQPSSCP